MLSEVKYLDPKTDLTFKKIFGNHPDLLISLLNALLPLDDDQQIESLEYLPAELVPIDPLHKDTIVDVRCKDQSGRQFVVEMQMAWTDAFKQRVLFNASKAYVSQAEMGYHYADLQPVYSLNLVNDIFERDTEEYKHNYRIVCDTDSNKVIEGLCFTFFELPKFRPHTMNEKRMTVLWLRFLTEINDKTRQVSAELLADPAISRALEEVRISAFSEGELLAYDKFWDMISRERTLLSESFKDGKEEGFKDGKEEGFKDGMEEGLKKGLEKGLKEGLEKGMEEGKVQIAKKLLSLQMPMEMIIEATGLTKEIIEKL